MCRPRHGCVGLPARPMIGARRERLLMQRARELIAPYTRREGVRGIYLVGSAGRPFRDAISGYDFEGAMSDEAYSSTPTAERHVFEIDPGPPRRVDHEFFLRSWSELEALVSSTRDVD